MQKQKWKINVIHVHRDTLGHLNTQKNTSSYAAAGVQHTHTHTHTHAHTHTHTHLHTHTCTHTALPQTNHECTTHVSREAWGVRREGNLGPSLPCTSWSLGRSSSLFLFFLLFFLFQSFTPMYLVVARKKLSSGLRGTGGVALPNSWAANHICIFASLFAKEMILPLSAAWESKIFFRSFPGLLVNGSTFAAVVFSRDHP